MRLCGRQGFQKWGMKGNHLFSVGSKKEKPLAAKRKLNPIKQICPVATGVAGAVLVQWLIRSPCSAHLRGVPAHPQHSGRRAKVGACSWHKWEDEVCLEKDEVERAAQRKWHLSKVLQGEWDS